MKTRSLILSIAAFSFAIVTAFASMTPVSINAKYRSTQSDPSTCTNYGTVDCVVSTNADCIVEVSPTIGNRLLYSTATPQCTQTLAFQ